MLQWMENNLPIIIIFAFGFIGGMVIVFISFVALGCK
jgi:hypothetical protein